MPNYDLKKIDNTCGPPKKKLKKNYLVNTLKKQIGQH